MSTPPSIPTSDLSHNAYCVLGLAICFVRQESEVKPIQVVEPIPSAALEALNKGITTSYKWAQAMALGDVLANETPTLPAGFPPEAHFCENFTERAIAAARTYSKVPQAQTIIPLGTRKTDFNHSTDRKRVLNAENIVSAEDNVKQHAYTHQVL